MGIDAAMLVRYRGEKPTDAELTRWSWDLCRSIGARHFFISEGLPPYEYQKANTAWHAAFEAHPEYARFVAGDASARDSIVADIGESPKRLRRAIELTNCRYPLDDDSEVPAKHRAPGFAWTQDGDAIYAQPGEYFLEVSLWTRYYGPGYERGDILTICAVAEWCEQNLPPCEVWYGGDSSGVLAEPFGPAERAAMRAHLYGAAGRDYFKHDKPGTFPTPKPCGLCVPGENRFNRYGWGNKYVAVSCGGCGKNFESLDSGVTWILKKDE